MIVLNGLDSNGLRKEQETRYLNMVLNFQGF
jgi:hypothetical protein